MNFENNNEIFMRVAIAAAETAGRMDEVPIGACLVSAAGDVLAVAGNRTITNLDPTAHAEILALRSAAARLSNYRLTGTVMYSTVEPCAMCAGALVNARVTRLIFGAADERFGAVRTRFRLCDSDLLNHQVEIVSGVLEDECRRLMQNFFRARR
ncbi:MAG: tRNA adenosine(34) deaminase TadA [Pyrinomonadaceae bacterium]